MNNNGNGNGHGFNPRWWASLRRRSRRPDEYLAPYRRIALQLHYDLPRPGNPRSVLLVTPTASTLCAHGSAALVRCLAEEVRQPVLLMDACPKDPQMSRLLDCATDRGFADMLSNPKLPLDDFVLPTTCENVSFLPAGANIASRPAPPEEMGTLLKAVESQYDFVLLSGGAVLNDSLVLALAPQVGCVLLLVIQNETMVEDFDAAQDALSFCKARKVGLVLATAVQGGGDLYMGVTHNGSKRVQLTNL